MEEATAPIAPAEAKAWQFVEAYIGASFNATEAAKQCFDIGSKGGKDPQRTAESMGSEYLRKPEVRRLLEGTLKKKYADGAFIIENLLRIVKDTKLERDRLKALELLGKMQAMFTDSQKVDLTNRTEELREAMKRQANSAKRVVWDKPAKKEEPGGEVGTGTVVGCGV